MSKGSARRPAQVDAETVEQNWQRIFGQKPCGNTLSTSQEMSLDTLEA